MQVIAIKCDRCGHIDEPSRFVRTKLFTDMYGYEQREVELCQCCADSKRNKDTEFMGGL